jgi:hypothetical protein
VPSERQILANRRNAQKSTGPRTAAGKAKVRVNALKHGLAARSQERLVEPRARQLAALALRCPTCKADRRAWAEAHTALQQAEIYRQKLMAEVLQHLDNVAPKEDVGRQIDALVAALRRLHRYERRLQAQLRKLENKEVERS